MPIIWNATMNNNLVLPCPTGQVSDGYHTFDELYDHRCLLFIVLGTQMGDAWKSRKHEDGSQFDGWFIAGIDLSLAFVGTPQPITYHLPNKYWDLCNFKELDIAEKWDGHTSQDVLARLEVYIKSPR